MNVIQFSLNVGDKSLIGLSRKQDFINFARVELNETNKQNVTIPFQFIGGIKENL